MRIQARTISLLAALWHLSWIRPATLSGTNECDQIVAYFLESRVNLLGSEPQKPVKMMFFLHVPRTAGRTLDTCFLKHAVPPSRRCLRQVDPPSSMQLYLPAVCCENFQNVRKISDKSLPTSRCKFVAPSNEWLHSAQNGD